MFIILPVIKTIESLFFVAMFLQMAFPPTVKEETKEVINTVANKAFIPSVIK